jgi:hypothetical protein
LSASSFSPCSPLLSDLVRLFSQTLCPSSLRPCAPLVSALRHLFSQTLFPSYCRAQAGTDAAPQVEPLASCSGGSFQAGPDRCIRRVGFVPLSDIWRRLNTTANPQCTVPGMVPTTSLRSSKTSISSTRTTPAAAITTAAPPLSECVAGYYGDGRMCTICPAGTYSAAGISLNLHSWQIHTIVRSVHSDSFSCWFERIKVSKGR